MTNPSNLDNKYFNHFLAKFINRVLTSLVAFGIALTFSFTIRAIFNIKPVTMIIIIFLFAIFISPITSKIKFNIGYIIEDKYFTFLEKYTEKWIKK